MLNINDKAWMKTHDMKDENSREELSLGGSLWHKSQKIPVYPLDLTFSFWWES